MQTITRQLWFSAGHRVHGHEGQCANMHGHNYNVFITAWAPKQDSVGRIIDFSVLKDRIDPWIQENWDHGFLWFKDDEFCRMAFEGISRFGFGFDGSGTFEQFFRDFSKQKNWMCPFNPTVENIAQYLIKICNEVLLKDTGVTVI